MLNIIFDATWITNYFQKDSTRSGIFFVAWSILKALQERNDVRIALYIDPKLSGKGAKIQKDLFPNLDYIFDYKSHPKLIAINLWLWKYHQKKYKHIFLRKPFALGMVLTRMLLKKVMRNHLNIEILNQADVYLSPAYCVPELIRKMSKTTNFIVLHDAIPYLFPEINSIKWALEGVFSSTHNNSDYFFCDSQQTLLDYKRLHLITADKKATVVYWAADEIFCPQKNIVQKKETFIKYHIPETKRYVFSLCSIEPRKNLIRAVRSFITFIEKNKIDDLVWVMGGGQWNSFAKEMKRKKIKWNPKYIIRAGYIDDEDLPILYSNAEWFVYTSQYEGFGLPPLEAMQCGCPVITSNNSSLPEVVADAGIMIDWDSDEQHIEAYERYYFDEELRNENSRKGIERAKFFSWKKTVEKMISEMKSKSRTKKHLDKLP